LSSSRFASPSAWPPQAPASRPPIQKDPRSFARILEERQRGRANEEINSALREGRTRRDFLEFGELMCLDALERDESCGGPLREEHATPDGEAKRDDDKFRPRAPGSTRARARKPVRNVEPLTFDYVHPTQRSYK